MIWVRTNGHRINYTETKIGYCNGDNHKLNALEYHRSSELDIAQTDLILLLGMQQDIENGDIYDTSKVEAFLVPAGTGVELYATTLRYAPCKKPDEEWVGVSSKWKTGKQYSIKRMTGGRVIEANTDFYRYLICHLPSAGVWNYKNGLP